MKLSDIPEAIQIELIRSATEIYKQKNSYSFYECINLVFKAYIKVEVGK